MKKLLKMGILQLVKKRHEDSNHKGFMMLLTLNSNRALFEHWTRLDMLNSSDEITRDSVIEFIAVEDELLRRGFGDADGNINPLQIKNFYK